MTPPEQMQDLLAFGRRGAVVPLLWLYGATVSEDAVTALGHTVRYPVAARSETLVEMRPAREPTPEDFEPIPFRAVRGGLRVSLPKRQAGHHAHTPITLKRARKREKATR